MWYFNELIWVKRFWQCSHSCCFSPSSQTNLRASPLSHEAEPPGSKLARTNSNKGSGGIKTSLTTGSPLIRTTRSQRLLNALFPILSSAKSQCDRFLKLPVERWSAEFSTFSCIRTSTPNADSDHWPHSNRRRNCGETV